MPVLHKDENIEIRKIVTGDYVNNAYLVVCPSTNQSVMIDAPAEPERVLEQAKDTNVQAVLFTHTHFDHIDGAPGHQGRPRRAVYRPSRRRG